MNIDAWFKTIPEKYAAQMRCRKGRTACCHGFFDISPGDTVAAVRGFDRLSSDIQRQVHSRATRVQESIRAAAANLPEPMLISDDNPVIDGIVEAVDQQPCPFLGDAGECLIYEHRPTTCRLGSMIDVREGLFGDWCELNFKDGIAEAAAKDLPEDYNAIDAFDETRSVAVAQCAGISDHRAVTFIPSVIAEFDRFWKSRI